MEGSKVNHAAHIAHVGAQLAEKGGVAGAVGGGVVTPALVVGVAAAFGATVALPVLLGAGLLGAILGAAGAWKK